MISISTNLTINNSIRQEKDYLAIAKFIAKIRLCVSLKKKNGSRRGSGKVLYFLISRVLNGKSLQIARQTISTARYVRLSIKQVGRILYELEEENIITVTRGAYRTTNIYHLNPLFFDEDVQHELRFYLPHFTNDRIASRAEQQQIIYANKVVSLYTHPTTVYDLKKMGGVNCSFSGLNELKMSLSLSNDLFNYYSHAQDANISLGNQFLIQPPSKLPDPELDLIFGSVDKEVLTKQKAGSTMQADLYQPILTGIEKLKSIRPTIYGQIKLSKFPLEALQYADAELLKAGNVRSPWGYFYKLCNTYCQTHNISIQYVMERELSRDLEMPIAPIFCDPNFLPKKPTVKHPTEKGAREVNWTKAQENQEHLNEWGVQRCLAQQQRVAAEFEKMAQDEPERYARIMKKAEELRAEYPFDVNPIAAVQALTNITVPIEELWDVEHQELIDYIDTYISLLGNSVSGWHKDYVVPIVNKGPSHHSVSNGIFIAALRHTKKQIEIEMTRRMDCQENQESVG